MQVERSQGRLLRTFRLAAFGARLGQRVKQSRLGGESWRKPLGHRVNNFPRLLVDQPSQQFGHQLRVARLQVGQSANRRDGLVVLAELAEPSHLEANQLGRDLGARLLGRLTQHGQLGIDELVPLGHCRGRIGGQPRPGQEPNSTRPLAALQALMNGVSRGGNGRIDDLAAKQQRRGGGLRELRRLLEPHQPAQSGDALCVGQTGQNPHPRLPRSGVQVLIIAQTLLHLRRIALRRPLDSHQPQQVSRAGGDFRVFVARGDFEGFNRVEPQAGQLVLRPLTHVIVLVAQLADELADLIGGGGILRCGGRGLGFLDACHNVARRPCRRHQC